MEIIKYLEPDLEVITFDEKDVITTSKNSFGELDPGSGEEQIFPKFGIY